MTKSDILELLAGLPDDTELTFSVKKADVEAALLKRGEGNPDRRIGTVEASEILGRSREWWADHAENIPGAVQEKKGAPWYFALGAARDYLINYENDRRPQRRSRARGPWKGRGT